MDWKTRLEYYQREAYLLARSDMPHGDHPAGTGVLDATFRAIESMVELELSRVAEECSTVPVQKKKCVGAHCKCMNLNGQCPSPHYGDHNCAYREPTQEVQE
jgi:hypothetical protein